MSKRKKLQTSGEGASPSKPCKNPRLGDSTGTPHSSQLGHLCHPEESEDGSAPASGLRGEEPDQVLFSSPSEETGAASKFLGEPEKESVPLAPSQNSVGRFVPQFAKPRKMVTRKAETREEDSKSELVSLEALPEPCTQQAGSQPLERSPGLPLQEARGPGDQTQADSASPEESFQNLMTPGSSRGDSQPQVILEAGTGPNRGDSQPQVTLEAGTGPNRGDSQPQVTLEAGTGPSRGDAQPQVTLEAGTGPSREDAQPQVTLEAGTGPSRGDSQPQLTLEAGTGPSRGDSPPLVTLEAGTGPNRNDFQYQVTLEAGTRPNCGDSQPQVTLEAGTGPNHGDAQPQVTLEAGTGPSCGDSQHQLTLEAGTGPSRGDSQPQVTLEAGTGPNRGDAQPQVTLEAGTGPSRGDSQNQVTLEAGTGPSREDAQPQVTLEAGTGPNRNDFQYQVTLEAGTGPNRNDFQYQVTLEAGTRPNCGDSQPQVTLEAGTGPSRGDSQPQVTLEAGTGPNRNDFQYQVTLEAGTRPNCGDSQPQVTLEAGTGPSRGDSQPQVTLEAGTGPSRGDSQPQVTLEAGTGPNRGDAQPQVTLEAGTGPNRGDAQPQVTLEAGTGPNRGDSQPQVTLEAGTGPNRGDAQPQVTLEAGTGPNRGDAQPQVTLEAGTGPNRGDSQNQVTLEAGTGPNRGDSQPQVTLEAGTGPNRGDAQPQVTLEAGTGPSRGDSQPQVTLEAGTGPNRGDSQNQVTLEAGTGPNRGDSQNQVTLEAGTGLSNMERASKNPPSEQGTKTLGSGNPQHDRPKTKRVWIPGQGRLPCSDAEKKEPKRIAALGETGVDLPWGAQEGDRNSLASAPTLAVPPCLKTWPVAQDLPNTRQIPSAVGREAEQSLGHHRCSSPETVVVLVDTGRAPPKMERRALVVAGPSSIPLSRKTTRGREETGLKVKPPRDTPVHPAAFPAQGPGSPKSTVDAEEFSHIGLEMGLGVDQTLLSRPGPEGPQGMYVLSLWEQPMDTQAAESGSQSHTQDLKWLSLALGASGLPEHTDTVDGPTQEILLCHRIPDTPAGLASPRPPDSSDQAPWQESALELDFLLDSQMRDALDAPDFEAPPEQICPAGRKASINLSSPGPHPSRGDPVTAAEVQLRKRDPTSPEEEEEREGPDRLTEAEMAASPPGSGWVSPGSVLPLHRTPASAPDGQPPSLATRPCAAGPGGLEDATRTVRGLVVELSNLNRLIMSTHRDLEAARRLSSKKARPPGRSLLLYPPKGAGSLPRRKPAWRDL